MNKQDLMRKRNDAMREIRMSNKVGSHRNCIRINVANSLEHELAKLRICYDLIKSGKEVFTEAIFNNGYRADIIVLDDYKIIEVLYSESEESCLEKAKKYPDLFSLEMVKVKGIEDRCHAWNLIFETEEKREEHFRQIGKDEIDVNK